MIKEQKLAKHKRTKQDLTLSRSLRNGASVIERKLWRELSIQAKANDLHFRRQHPIHPYVVDFACLQARLLVEIDGSSHDGTQVYDQIREEKLISLGYGVIRFSNHQVCENVSGVVDTIIDAGKKRLPVLV